MSKPKTRDELLDQLDTMLIRTIADIITEWGNCEVGKELAEKIRQAYYRIKALIQNQPEVVVTYHSGKKEGYKVQPEIDVNEIIDCVLKNSYVESEKTSDGVREYYDNQLFPEKGCEEKVRKLLQGMK